MTGSNFFFGLLEDAGVVEGVLRERSRGVRNDSSRPVPNEVEEAFNKPRPKAGLRGSDPMLDKLNAGGLVVALLLCSDSAITPKNGKFY